MLEQTITVKGEYTNNAYRIGQIFKKLDECYPLVALDFETASKYTLQEKTKMKYALDNYKLSFEDRRLLLQKYTSDGLSNPEFTCITHLNIGISEDTAYVIICDTNKIRQMVFNWIVNTNCIQLWHNIGFDGKHIYANTGTLPHYYIDTQLMAKCLFNNANPFRDRTGLKELMGKYYGQWSVAKEVAFTLENIYDERLLYYCAVDAAATFKLYDDLIKYQIQQNFI